MIRDHGETVHIEIGNILLIIDKNIFIEALQRGKAYKRAKTQHLREQQMAKAAERKRQMRDVH